MPQAGLPAAPQRPEPPQPRVLPVSTAAATDPPAAIGCRLPAKFCRLRVADQPCPRQPARQRPAVTVAVPPRWPAATIPLSWQGVLRFPPARGPATAGVAPENPCPQGLQQPESLPGRLRQNRANRHRHAIRRLPAIPVIAIVVLLRLSKPVTYSLHHGYRKQVACHFDATRQRFTEKHCRKTICAKRSTENYLRFRNRLRPTSSSAAW